MQGQWLDRFRNGTSIGQVPGVWWGAVAQLGERLVRNEEVSGSIPLSSTNESTTRNRAVKVWLVVPGSCSRPSAFAPFSRRNFSLIRFQPRLPQHRKELHLGAHVDGLRSQFSVAIEDKCPRHAVDVERLADFV